MQDDYKPLNVETHPNFIVKLTQAVAKSWDSLGSVACKFNEISEGYYEVMYFPAVREIYGGKTDGECIFAGFHFNIGKFVKSFDKSPSVKVAFDALRSDVVPHLAFKGYIDGTCLKVLIMSEPPCGQRAIERIHASGPKRGQVETITRG